MQACAASGKLVQGKLTFYRPFHCQRSCWLVSGMVKGLVLVHECAEL